jgi:Uma2 family endonuclease
MTLAATKMTAEQFFMLGEDPPGLRLELVNGEIAVSPSPSFDHSFTDSQLRIILGQHINDHDLGAMVGDMDTIFDDLNVRRPDIIFLAKSRLKLIKGQGIPIIPDLCVEILSPSSATMDQTDKFELYAKSGVPCYWIVDPKGHSFEAYKLVAKKYRRVVTARQHDIVSAPPFQNLKIPLAKVWSPIN